MVEVARSRQLKVATELSRYSISTVFTVFTSRTYLSRCIQTFVLLWGALFLVLAAFSLLFARGYCHRQCWSGHSELLHGCGMIHYWRVVIRHPWCWYGAGQLCNWSRGLLRKIYGVKQHTLMQWRHWWQFQVRVPTINIKSSIMQPQVTKLSPSFFNCYSLAKS